MPATHRASIFPCLRYRDAPAAIDWLTKAFGFEKKVAYEGPDGTVLHAELRLGDDYIMLGSVKEDAFDWWPPAEVGGKSTQTIYVVVPDPDALFDRAKNAGAETLRPLTDTDYGSRDFSVRDPEGHIWNFGTYHPGD
jgi:uncharacterized glyoxalase superfamily protein PhnB